MSDCAQETCQNWTGDGCACAVFGLDPVVADCASCGEGMPRNECKQSKRACGHHCNHSWEQDECCWCETTFGENGEETHPNNAEGVTA